MTSHIKSSLLGSSVSFPVKNGIPQLGTWQGIYLWSTGIMLQREELLSL